MESKCKDNLRIWNEITDGSSSSIKETETGYWIDTSSKHDCNIQQGTNQTDLSRLPLPENRSMKISANKILGKGGDGKIPTATIADITKPPTYDSTPYLWYAEMFRKQRERKTQKQVKRALAVVVISMLLTLAVILGIAVFIWNRDKIFT